MKLTQESFNKIYSQDISKREYDEIIKEIDDRFGDVVMLVNPSIKKNGGWFVYGNCDYNSRTDEGCFEPDEYNEYITVGGEGKFPEPYCNSDEGFGYICTRWLWMEDSEILNEYNAEVEKAILEYIHKKEMGKQKRETAKLKKAEMKKIITAKLTKEELKYISFK